MKASGGDWKTRAALLMNEMKPANVRERWRETDVKKAVGEMRGSRRLIVLIVFIAIFLDNMLLSVVVPIVPRLLINENHPNWTGPGGEESVSVVKFYCKPKSATSSAEIQNSTADWRNISDKDYAEQNLRVGLMFASKAIVQLIANSIVGPLSNKVGYSILLFSGFVILFVSTVMFAFLNNFYLLMMARSLQGIGSSCSSVSGMGMLADRYPDDEERGRVMAIALSGLALGVMVGPPFGGIMFDLFGKSVPFLVLATLALIDGLLQLFAFQVKIKPQEQEGTALFTLLRDPYILIAAGAITLGNMGIGMLEPSLPLHMMKVMHATEWQTGSAFLPTSISYMFGTNIFGTLAHRIGRWLCALIGLVIISFSLAAIPLATEIVHLIIPSFCLGFSIGMVDSSMMPTMAQLVDLRHVSVYGSVYAIADVAFCMSFAVGPALGGNIALHWGFETMLWIMAGLTLLYAPLCYYLKNPPAKAGEDANLLGNTPVFGQYGDLGGQQFHRLDEDPSEMGASSKQSSPGKNYYGGYDADDDTTSPVATSAFTEQHGVIHGNSISYTPVYEGQKPQDQPQYEY